MAFEVRAPRRGGTMCGPARQEIDPRCPHVATSPADLLAALAGSAHLDGERLVVDDEAARSAAAAIRDLAWTAAFSDDEATTAAAQWLVWEASQALGARSASMQALYEARARGEVSGFTSPGDQPAGAGVPNMARTVYETAAGAAGVGAVILELARSEQTYTFQRPIDYATSVLAGAVAAGWQGPVFIQGDHYQFNAKKYAADPEAMTEEIRRACRLAIDAGYRNIDIDSSTLVDLSKPNVDEEQRENYRRAAELTALIRTLEGDGVTVSVGGEIGEVGTQNSTVAELRAYLDGYRRELERAWAPGAKGISKISVQTGTSHGGVPLPDGGVAEVKLDFEVAARARASVAREYGLAGAVQHGASTLPDELFHRFPAVETAEIHLATGFQNTLYEHPRLPAGAPSRDRGVVLRQRRRTVRKGRPDRPAVRVHDAQEGDRAVQAPAVGAGDARDEILAAQRRKIAVPVQRAAGSTTRAGWSSTCSRSSCTARSPGRSPFSGDRGGLGLEYAAAVRKAVEGPPIAHVVTLNPSGTAQITMAWTEGDEIVIGTMFDQLKPENIRRDKQVDLVRDRTDESRGLPGYVVVHGRARLTDGGAPAVLQRLARGYMGPDVVFPGPSARKAGSSASESTQISGSDVALRHG